MWTYYICTATTICIKFELFPIKIRKSNIFCERKAELQLVYIANSEILKFTLVAYPSYTWLFLQGTRSI